MQAGAGRDGDTKILRGERGKRDIHFPCSADREQDWQPCPVDPYSAIRDNHTDILPRVHSHRASSPQGSFQQSVLPFHVSAWTNFCAPLFSHTHYSIGTVEMCDTDTV